MGHKLNQLLSTRTLADALGLSWRGQDVPIKQVSSLSEIEDGALSFAKSGSLGDLKVCATIISPFGTEFGAGGVIETDNPRLAFARALHFISENIGFSSDFLETFIAPDAIISSTAVIGRGVRVGARTVIGHHTVISDGCVIGEQCHIKSHAVIGEMGFGFEPDENGIPIRMPHLGSVQIGDRVEIGSFTTVCRGTLSPTILESDAKIDDHVHIAHNCRIRRGALVTACAEISGGVDLGEFAWVGPNSSIIQKVKIGERAFIGIGSNVTKSVAEGVVVAGNPAKALRKEN